MATILGVLAMADALFVMIGWLFGIEALKRVSGSWTTMKFNTALAVFCVGAALAWHRHARMRTIGGGVAAAIGALTLAEYVLGVSLGIDELIVFAASEGGSVPGRMSPATASGCLLLGTSAMLLRARQVVGRTVCETAAIGAAVIGCIGVLGYVSGAENLYRIPGFLTISMQTAVVFILAAIGCLVAAPDGFVAVHVRVRRGGLALWSGFLMLTLLFGAIGFLSSLRVRELSSRRAAESAEVAGGAPSADPAGVRQDLNERLRSIESVTIVMLIVGVVTAIGTAAAVSRVVLSGHEALRASEERLKHAQHLVGLGVWEWNPRTDRAHWSDEMYRIYGIDADLFSGRGTDYIQHTHPDDVKVVRDAMERVVDQAPENALGGEAAPTAHTELSYRICRPDGTVRWLRSAIARQAGDPDGDERILGVVWDETEQRESTETVKRERDRAQLYLDIAATMLIGLGRDGSVSLVNRRACEVLGYQQEQLLGRDWFEACVPGEERARVREYFDRCMRGEVDVPQHFETHVVTRSGERRMISWHNTVVRDGTGAISGTLSSAEDITERRAAEAAAREAEAKFRQIAENIREVFWVFDLGANRLVYVSPAYETVWGRLRSELEVRPKSWFDAVHPEDRERVESFVRGQATGDCAATYRIARPDGSIRWIHDRSYLVRGPDGAATRVVGIAEDVTQSRDLEAQLRQAQKMEAMGTLAGGIAHDFNNILGAIVGFSQLARMRAGDDPVMREYLEDIDLASHRAVELVRQILSFSRQRKSERSPIDLAEPVSESLRLLRATIPANIELRSQLASECGKVLADPSQIHQVVVNLGTNAWHAMAPDPGVLEVQLQACELTRRDVDRDARLRPGRFVRLVVSDTGHGMDAATIARIFDPFFTTKGPGLGTGLGLSVVHGIVADHEGVITVDSKPGQGTAFSVYLPVIESPGDLAASAREGLVRGRGETIMFIDDEQALVRVCTLMLERLGYRVQAFTEAETALKVLESEPGRFDVVVTDKSMPGLGGVEVAARVAAIRSDLPVILTSGYLEGEASGFLRLPGVRCALMKPLEIGPFSRALADVLGQTPKS
jgi:PAS domain S-box-containing protein